MINNGLEICPCCGGKLKRHGKVSRIVRTIGGKKYRVSVQRFICSLCGSTHRMLPEYLTPYKHYEKAIITGFLNGSITSFNLDYEDYPCDSTIYKWKIWNKC